jgi:hypothetical protein
MTWSSTGKGLVLCGLVATLAAVFIKARPWSFIALAMLVLWSAGVMAIDALYRRRAVQRFRAVWEPQGKDLLLVYSNSPHWQQYVEANWLTRWNARAVVLNWSERRSWQTPPRATAPEVVLFQAFSGPREFNPLAIVVPPRGHAVHIVRFWKAFRDHKHGKPAGLRTCEAQVEEFLAKASEPVEVVRP